jgi:acetoacetyl-CoA synthetase
MEFIQQHYHVSLADYTSLHQWSVRYPALFWPALWEFSQVIASQKWDEVLLYPEQMPGAQWFVGARLNFAENLNS